MSLYTYVLIQYDQMSVLIHNLVHIVHIIGNDTSVQNIPVVELSHLIYHCYTWIKQHMSKPQYCTYLAYYMWMWYNYFRTYMNIFNLSTSSIYYIIVFRNVSINNNSVCMLEDETTWLCIQSVNHSPWQTHEACQT